MRLYPELFSTILTLVKAAELVADFFFSRGWEGVTPLRRSLSQGFRPFWRRMKGLSLDRQRAPPLTIFYAFRQTDINSIGDGLSRGGVHRLGNDVVDAFLGPG